MGIFQNSKKFKNCSRQALRVSRRKLGWRFTACFESDLNPYSKVFLVKGKEGIRRCGRPPKWVCVFLCHFCVLSRVFGVACIFSSVRLCLLKALFFCDPLPCSFSLFAAPRSSQEPFFESLLVCRCGFASSIRSSLHCFALCFALYSRVAIAQSCFSVKHVLSIIFDFLPLSHVCFTWCRATVLLHNLVSLRWNIRLTDSLKLEPGCQLQLCDGLLTKLTNGSRCLVRQLTLFRKLSLWGASWKFPIDECSSVETRLSFHLGGIEEGSSCPLDIHKVLRQGPKTFRNFYFEIL